MANTTLFAIGLFAVLGLVLAGCANAPPEQLLAGDAPSATGGDPVVDSLDQTLDSPGDIDADPLADLETLDEDLAALE